MTLMEWAQKYFGHDEVTGGLGDGRVKAFILGLSGDLAGHRFPVGKVPVTFGRGDDNDIVLGDPAVPASTPSYGRRPTALFSPTWAAPTATG